MDDVHKVREKGRGRGCSRREQCLIVLILVLAVVVFLALFLVFFFKDKDNKGSEEETGTVEKSEDICNTLGCLESAYAMQRSMDLEADPCEDFYQFACGKMALHYPLTPQRPRVTQTTLIEEATDSALRALLEKGEEDTIAAIKQTRNFYRSCLDTEAMDAKGVQPMLELLNSSAPSDNSSNSNSNSSSSYHLFPTLEPNWVDENLTLAQILARVGRVGGMGASPIITMSVSPDFSTSHRHVVLFTQPSTQPRSVFLGDRNSSQLLGYQDLYRALTVMLGADPGTAAVDAVDVVDFEILLYNATTPYWLRQDVGKLLKKMTLRELSNRLPQFDWLGYLQTRFSPVGISFTQDEVVALDALQYYENLLPVISSVSRRTLMNYCMWKFVVSYARHLDSSVRRLVSGFSSLQTEEEDGAGGLFSRVDERSSGPSPSSGGWRQCVLTTGRLLPDTTGRLYVDQFFSPRAKSKVEDMIVNLKEAFRDIVREADWMGSETKQAALAKIDNMVNKVGYSDAIKNDTYLNEKMKNLYLREDEYFNNYVNISRERHLHRFRQLRQPVDRNEWSVSAAMVNAVYDIAENSIMPLATESLIPAAPDASVPRRHLWRPEINGNLTLTENIADNGGLKEAFMAYQRVEARRRRGGQGGDSTLPGLGFSPDQLFFISAAQMSCSNTHPFLLERQLRTSHSPERFRAIGPARNYADFSKAFSCRAGSYMNPAHRCRVW
ncbi:neprilysin-1-like [Babylonia areolata]|uniref:neprilysin-1-like n=1 Tax=Babylonia areolata TaxID=304850 RepID=UPI003FCF5307